MIKLENVCFQYHTGIQALINVNLEIMEGVVLAIMGENGAGKTTLIKHLNGLLKPSKGRVVVDDLDTKRVSVAELSRKIGIVFQNPESQFFCETVWDEVAYGLKNFNYPKNLITERVEEVLKLLNLENVKTSIPFKLSEGEKRRLAIACVLAWNPKYLVLDEPTLWQDYDEKLRLQEIIGKLTSKNKTVIIATHDVEFITELDCKAVLMSKGRIVAEGKVEEVLEKTNLLSEANLEEPEIVRLCYMLKELNPPKKVFTLNKAKKFLMEKFKGLKIS
ncbi:MAG: energy-coupling factor ABC transporter ATP-binding protein [Candidatus Bathyarchaeota archaeon]